VRGTLPWCVEPSRALYVWIWTLWFGNPRRGSSNTCAGRAGTRAFMLVRIGNIFAVVLTALGRVWTFAESSSGQFGTCSMRQMMPPQLLEGHISQLKIVQVSCGGMHTLAMTESGCQFSWGCNDRGPLGLGLQSPFHSRND
jgi:alpha-tubulin suppressor-like RCC1 family protein